MRETTVTGRRLAYRTACTTWVRASVPRTATTCPRPFAQGPGRPIPRCQSRSSRSATLRPPPGSVGGEPSPRFKCRRASLGRWSLRSCLSGSRVFTGVTEAGPAATEAALELLLLSVTSSCCHRGADAAPVNMSMLTRLTTLSRNLANERGGRWGQLGRCGVCVCAHNNAPVG